MSVFGGQGLARGLTYLAMSDDAPKWDVTHALSGFYENDMSGRRIISAVPVFFGTPEAV